MNLALGEALEGKYEILDKIGEGGMGSVYKVRHRLLEEVRVIKVLRPHASEMEDLQRRFLHEARMAIKLKHPNIAQLHDFSIAADGTAYIVMEFIDGIGLDALLKTSGPPSVDLSVEFSMQALAALHYLHEHQFVHRDVSPDNLMLTSSFDGSPLLKLIDLGIAKNLDAEAQLTQTGVFLGKVRYCSPEQFSGTQGGEEVLDRGSDIYSFGVLLYEMLTGIYPFNGESFAELAGSHLFQQPKSFDETDPDGAIPQGLRDVVLKALEKDRADRFDTAEVFANDLAAYRNPDIVLKDEFDRTVEVTTSALPKMGDYSKPGSTQGRINREFGLEMTTGPTALTDSRKPTDKPAAPAGRTLLTPIRIVAAAGVLVLAIASIATWSLLSGGEQPAGAEADLVAGGLGEVEISALEFQATERWSADSPGGADLDADVLAETEPPLSDEDAAEQAAIAARERTRPTSPPRQEPVRQPVVEQPTEPVAAETGPVMPAADEIEVFQPGIGVVAPVLLELPTPVVPDDVRPPKEEVVYMVRVLVDEYGEVQTAVVESGPAFKRRLREAAADAAKLASFQPASKDGMVGRMWTEVRIVYAPE